MSATPALRQRYVVDAIDARYAVTRVYDDMLLLFA